MVNQTFGFGFGTHKKTVGHKARSTRRRQKAGEQRPRRSGHGD
jgi:hypothetical protein